MYLKGLGIALVVSIGLAPSQSEKSSQPKFEVTSVKPNKSPDLCKALIQYLPGGRYVATNVPLIRVIASAWSLPLQSQRLIVASGVRMPDEIYDIEATSEKGTFPPAIAWEARYHTMQLMVQVLLEDRFKLRVRREPKAATLRQDRADWFLQHPDRRLDAYEAGRPSKLRGQRR